MITTMIRKGATMANKFGKFLLLTAAAGAAAAGAYYYLKKKENAFSAEYDADEDFDDFSDDDLDAEPSRNYVPLNFDCGCADEVERTCEGSAQCTCDENAECCCDESAKCTCEEPFAADEIEDFFDEEDPADQEPAIRD
jgi:hypothetical protein